MFYEIVSAIIIIIVLTRRSFVGHLFIKKFVDNDSEIGGNTDEILLLLIKICPGV